MRRDAQNSSPSCPNCGKRIQTTRNVYEYPRINNVTTKVKVGTAAKDNYYAPFCTLRCGWRYGQWAYKRGRKKHG